MGALLERAGFSDVNVLYNVAWASPVLFVVGRRGTS